MRKILHLVTILSVIACTALSSCVGKGKYLASEARVRSLMDDSTATHQKLDACNMQVSTLEGEKSTLQAQTANMDKNLRDLQEAASKSKMTIADQAKRLKDLETLIQSQRDVMNRLRQSIANALVNFKPDELSVYIKDGNVYVSMEEKLLFKSGSAVVDPKGKEALGKLASVLNVTPDVSVLVEGHTDTVPIKTEKFSDNWALSVGRATSIVRILTKDYGLNPRRVIASGKGEFHPVRTNESSEGRASNRRTEIILTPDLKELYALLGQ